jgi:hypothetical protein
MTLPIIPGGFCAAFSALLYQNLADRFEAVVGNEAQFLTKIDANSPCILVKLQTIEFD